MKKPFDFSGWATKNNLKCSDGRTILKNAFADCDGKQVPLVWNHQHKEPFNVLGHAILENKEDGVYSYCYFNDTDQGKNAKMLLEHGDISALSIYASELRQRGSDVIHGVIREVSLVLAGANPGAYIDNVVLAHGEDADGEAVIYTGEGIELYHADEGQKEESPKKKEKEDDDSEKGETYQDIVNSMSEKQQNVFYGVIGALTQKYESKEEKKDDDEDGGKSAMKHNVFENNNSYAPNYLQHADQQAILNLAKSNAVGSFREALEIFAENNGMVLQHDATSGGFIQDPSQDGNVTWLFPEYKDVRPGAPELITNDQGWISVVMNKVHKSPISRIRTSQVDIRNIDALRAKGYQKGKEKSLSGNFKLVRRTHDPQTVYVRNALHRDDIIDITDFDYVQYLYKIDRMMLDEELATAIMLGDGREDGDPDKIYPEHIRPIWTDDDLYTLHVDLDVEAAREELQGTETGSYFGENFIYSEAMVNACLYARENFKGTGTPDMYITPHMLNVMLLARDRNGRRIYTSKAELASTLNVGEIYTAEQFANKTRTAGSGASARTKKLLALIVNLADYSLGSTKGGEITHFTQFDIKFNQELSLIETRLSGANTRVYSAIAIEEDVTE